MELLCFVAGGIFVLAGVYVGNSISRYGTLTKEKMKGSLDVKS